MVKYFHTLLAGFFIFVSFSPVLSVFAECTISDGDITGGSSISELLKSSDCAPVGSVTSSDYSIAWGVKAKVVSITNQLILVGSILSVWGIVFAAILYVTALGDGEKVKKAKTALQFSVIGFILMLLSFPIVNALVNLIYWIG